MPILAPSQYASVKGGPKTPLITRTALLFYKDKENKLHAVVKVRLPDGNSTISQFSGLLLYQDWKGNPLKSFLFKDGKQYTFSSNAIKNNPLIVETTAPYYECYDIDHYTCVTVGEVDFPCNYEYTTTNCTLIPGSGGGGGGGTSGGVTEPKGSGWPYPIILKPGDRICPGSFNYTNQSQTGAYYLTNMIGMKIEDGVNTHNMPPTVFSLTNGITDLVMTSVSRDDYWGQDETPLQYLKDRFPELFPNEIKSTTKNGKKIWNFTPKAAAIISAFAANLAGQLTATIIPGSALEGNPVTNDVFYEISNSILKTYMPGSAIFQGSRSTATTSNANYKVNCLW